MKKCGFIIPYFGKLPNYFPLFLKTCMYNKDYDWQIFTNDRTNYNYPSNVIRHDMSFSQLQKLFQSKFDFKISLDVPYKLCDYKPSYGLVFAEYLKDYRFWGHCDLDTIIGNLDNFLTDEMLSSYDKIFCLGHMSLYRNISEITNLFKKAYKGRLLYKQIFTVPTIEYFDEEFRDEYNINHIFIDNGKKILTKDYSLNFSIFKNNFYRVTLNFGCKKLYTIEEFKDAIYMWSKGKILRSYIENGNIKNEEYPYMHLQARKMKYKPSIVLANAFQIRANRFDATHYLVVDKDIFFKFNRNSTRLHIWQLRYRTYSKRYKNKIKKILSNLWQ